MKDLQRRRDQHAWAYLEKIAPHIANDEYYQENPDKSWTYSAYKDGRADAVKEMEARYAPLVEAAQFMFDKWNRTPFGQEQSVDSSIRLVGRALAKLKGADDEQA